MVVIFLSNLEVKGPIKCFFFQKIKIKMLEQNWKYQIRVITVVLKVENTKFGVITANGHFEFKYRYMLADA